MGLMQVEVAGKSFLVSDAYHWLDVSHEAERRYYFGDGMGSVIISSPLLAGTDLEGNCRIVTENEAIHYVPFGWLQLSCIPRRQPRGTVH
jgi:hypothetical protein